jgi:hypothetical protein
MRYWAIFIFMLVSAVEAYPYKLKIIRLNTPSIKIGDKVCRVNDTFEDTDIIHWESPKQDMWAKVQTNTSRAIKHFNGDAYSKRKSKTVNDYFNKINHPSVRADEMSLSKSKSSESYSDSRIALVIGNSNYEYLSNLNNPISDCTDISEKLLELGFDVFSLYDANYTDFDTALKKFSGQAKEYDVAMIYYSGHGIEFESHNYLIPIDVTLNSSEDLFNCIELDDVYSRLNRISCKTKLVFYDACSNNPSWKSVKNSDAESRSAIYTVYSSASNAFAFDGENRNSPFTSAFLNNVDKPHKAVSSLVDDISREVEKTTDNQQRVTVVGAPAYAFTFSDKVEIDGVIDYSVLNISELENLAANGDKKAYVPIAKYYLKNAYGVTDYDLVYEYATKALQQDVDTEDAIILIRKLDALDYFSVSSNINPLKK